MIIKLNKDQAEKLGLQEDQRIEILDENIVVLTNDIQKAIGNLLNFLKTRDKPYYEKIKKSRDALRKDLVPIVIKYKK